MLPTRPILLSTADAALYSRVPQGTIRRWAHEGRLTRYGTRARRRYDLAELDAVVEAHGDRDRTKERAT